MYSKTATEEKIFVYYPDMQTCTYMHTILQLIFKEKVQKYNFKPLKMAAISRVEGLGKSRSDVKR